MNKLDSKKIKELRSITGAGLLDCKKALEASFYNIDKAFCVLKDIGVIKANKKYGNKTLHGVVIYYIEGKQGCIIKLATETDFASKSKIFSRLSTRVVYIANTFPFLTIKDFFNLLFSGLTKVFDIINDTINRLGENISLKYLERVSILKGEIITYVHNKYNEQSGKIIVFILCEGCLSNKIYNFAKILSMHTASLKPSYFSINTLDDNFFYIERQKFVQEIRNRNLSKCIFENIIIGKMKKFLSENVLMEQPFIMNKKINILYLMVQLNKKYQFRLKNYSRVEINT